MNGPLLKDRVLLVSGGTQGLVPALPAGRQPKARPASP